MNASSDIVRGNSLDAALASPNLRLRVGEHIVDMGALRVITQPDAARLTSKAAAVLLELARHAGNTVTRDQLMDSVWAGRVTTPDVLTQAIKELRRAFGDDKRPSHYIETIPRIGYRLVAMVSTIDVTKAPAAIATSNFANGIGNDASNSEEIIETAHLSTTQPRIHVRQRLPWFATTGIGAIAVVAAITFAITHLPPAQLDTTRHAQASATTWAVKNLRAITSAPGPERRPQLSPDGTRVVYAKLDPATKFERLYIQSLSADSRAITLTTDITGHEEMATWSPDGTQIAYEQLGKDEICKLFVVPSLGGAPKQIAPCGNFIVNYFDWTPDAKSLITSGETTSDAGSVLSLTLLDIATGKKQPLHYQRNATDQDIEAHYSPDGRTIVFRRGLSPHSDLYLADAATGKVRQLTHLSTRILGSSWTPDGRNVLFSYAPDGKYSIYAAAISDGSLQDLNLSPAAYPDAALNNAVVVYEIPRTKMNLTQIDVAAGTQITKFLAPSTGSDATPEFSPDGKHIAFVSNRSGSEQAWLADADGSDPIVLTQYRNASIPAVAWSYDAKRLLICVRSNDAVALVELDLATRRKRNVAMSQSSVLYATYGPDPDSYFVARQMHDGSREFVVLRRADTAAETATVLVSGIELAQFDPTTRDVYYTKTSSPGLFRKTLAGDAEQLVTTRVNSAIIAGWRIVDGRVWYVSGLLINPFELHEYDPTSHKDRALVKVNAALRDDNFSVSPAHDRVIFTPLGPEDIDVGAFDLTRNAAAK